MEHWTIDDDPDQGIEEMRAQLKALREGYDQLERDLDKLAQISEEIRVVMRPPPEEVEDAKVCISVPGPRA